MVISARNDAQTPLVSVVIPTRDRPELLHGAIASVKAQTFTNYEIIVVVNGPDNPLTAKTLEVATGHGCEVVRINRSGIAVALNAGMQAARGEWVAFLDDDDLWAPNKLEVELDLARTANADLLFSDFSVADGNRRVQAPSQRPPQSLSTPEAMTLRNYGGGCSTTTVRRSAALAVGGFDETLVSPDWDMWMRLSWRYRVAWTGAYLVVIRHHGQNTSKQISWAYWTLRIQRKSLRTLPRELRHMRLAIIGQMMRVAMKGAETYFRHKCVVPLRSHLRSKA